MLFKLYVYLLLYSGVINMKGEQHRKQHKIGVNEFFKAVGNYFVNLKKSDKRYSDKILTNLVSNLENYEKVKNKTKGDLNNREYISYLLIIAKNLYTLMKEYKSFYERNKNKSSIGKSKISIIEIEREIYPKYISFLEKIKDEQIEDIRNKIIDGRIEDVEREYLKSIQPYKSRLEEINKISNNENQNQ